MSGRRGSMRHAVLLLAPAHSAFAVSNAAVRGFRDGTILVQRQLSAEK